MAGCEDGQQQAQAKDNGELKKKTNKQAEVWPRKRAENAKTQRLNCDEARTSKEPECFYGRGAHCF